MRLSIQIIHTDGGGQAQRPVRRRRGRSKLLFLSVLCAALGLAGFGVYSAYTATTTNTGNSFASGTVSITDNDSSTAMLSLANAKPGDSDSSCVRVTYTGSLAANVHLYGASSGGLAPYLTLTITRGTDPSPSFDSCTGFTPDATNYIGAGAGIVYQGALSAFGTNWATGVVDPVTGSPESWTLNEFHSYRYTITLGRQQRGPEPDRDGLLHLGGSEPVTSVTTSHDISAAYARAWDARVRRSTVGRIVRIACLFAGRVHGHDRVRGHGAAGVRHALVRRPVGEHGADDLDRRRHRRQDDLAARGEGRRRRQLPRPGERFARLLSHRVTQIHVMPEGVAFVTKGDANTGVERWQIARNGTIGRAEYHVPKLGYLTNRLGSRFGRLLFFVLPLILLAGLELRRLWNSDDDDPKEPSDASAH